MSFIVRSPTSAANNLPVPGETRATIAGVIVDYTGLVPPTNTEVQAQHNPSAVQRASQIAAAAIEAMTKNDAERMRIRAESIQAFRAVKAIIDRDAAWRAVFAAATNFADLKARVAAMPPLPNLTRADWKAAVVAIMNADDPNG